MASVDERVVSMQFDNKAFGEKVADTISSIDKLKKSLDFANSTKSLDTLSAASNSFGMSGLSSIASAVENISSKFSAMGAIAFSILNNLVTRAVDAGIQLGKSLSLNQIISGFHEYETNMNAIQTILSNTKSKGTDLEDVNRALDELNTYSDQTIYNFSEMTRNIGTFTAAGVGLDKSVQSIKGIANLAAISGSNSQQASTAMYQLSQAIAAGSVKLMDWNSVVNAGMGGEVFQKALFETGKTLGKIKDVPIGMTFEEWTKKGNTFRGSLETGWLTAEVLTNTLAGFTGDLTDAQLKAMGYNEMQIKQIQEMGQIGKDAATKVKTFTQLLSTAKEAVGSGWSAAFRVILGDFEEARNTFTMFSEAIGKVISAASDARMVLLSNWKNLGGRDELIIAITSAFRALASVIKVVKDAFHEVFPKTTPRELYNLTVRFSEFIQSLNMGWGTFDKVRKILRGVFSAIAIGIDIVKEVVGVFGALIDKFASSGDDNGGLLAFLAKMADRVTNFKKTLDESKGIEKFFDKIKNAIASFDASGIIDFFDSVVTAVGNFVKGLSFENVIQRIIDLFKGLGQAVTDIIPQEAVDKVHERFSSIFSVFDKLGDAAAWVWDKMSSVWDIIKKFGSMIKEAFKGVPQAIADAFANTSYDQALDTINTGLFAGLVLLIRKFLSNPMKMGGNFLKSINTALGSLTGILKAMQTDIKASAILKIAGALGILTISLVVLSLMDSAALTKALTAVSAGFGVLVGAMTLLDKGISGTKSATKIAVLAAGMIAFAAAMLILSVAIKILSSMSWEELTRGMTAVGVMLAMLVATTKLMSGSNLGMIGAGIGILAIAVALNILAGAVKLFSMMSWKELEKGFAAVAAGLGIITLAVNLMPNGPGMALKGAGMVEIAVALTILAGAVKLFSMMKWKDLEKGFAAVAVGLGVIALATQLMPNGASLALQGVGLLLISVAITAIAGAIKILSTMSWEELGKGLASIAVSLGILAAAGHLMSGTIGGAVAIGIMAGSLLLLGQAVKIFANLSWGDLLHGLVGVAASIAVLALAALAVSPILPLLFGLAAALALIGAAFALFGIGVNLVAAGFAILATSGTQGVATLASAVDLLAEKLPFIIQALGEAIIALAGQLIAALPEMIAGMGQVIAALLQVLIDNMPKFGELLVQMIRTGLAALRETFPEILQTGFDLLLQLLQGISDHIEEITNKVVDIVVKFLEAMAGRAGDLATAGTDFLIAFIGGITANLGRILDAVALMIGAFINGIGAFANQIIAAGFTALVNFLNGISENLYLLIGAAADLLIKFFQGIKDNIIKVTNAAFEIVIALINGIADAINDHIDELRNAGMRLAGALINGMTLGLAGKAGGLIKKVLGIGGDVKGTISDSLGIKSPSTVFIGFGEAAVEGFAIGLSNTSAAVNSAENMGEKIITTFQTTLGRVSDAISGIEGFNPTITPVLDLTDVTRDAKALNKMLESTKPINAELSYSQASVIATTSNAAAAELAQESATPVVKEIKFEQNNYSPEALSTADIYRKTKNQIALAKEELLIS